MQHADVKDLHEPQFGGETLAFEREENGGPLLSVLIPAYNVESFIGECLDSILSQDMKNFEVLVVDDGSTDGTGGLLAECAAEEPRLRFFRQENAGPAKARNRLLDEARGRWIYFCDADDKVLPGAFSRMLSEAERRGTDLLFFAAEIFYDSPELEAIHPEFKTRYAFSKDFSSVRSGQAFLADCVEAEEWKSLLWLMLFRRNLISDGGVRFPEGNIHDDDFFVPSVTLRAAKAARIPEVFYARRIRAGSIMTASSPFDSIRSCAANAATLFARSYDGTLELRTRAALGEIADRIVRRIRRMQFLLPEEDMDRLLRDAPAQRQWFDLLSRTRTEREYQRVRQAIQKRQEGIERRDAAIAAKNAQLKKLRAALADREWTIRRILRSRTYRVAMCLARPFRFAKRLLARGAKRGGPA